MPDTTGRRAMDATVKDSTDTAIAEDTARIEFDIPLSKGELAEPASRTAPEVSSQAQTGPGSRAPGTRMDHEEARVRMAGVDLGPEGSARANALLGHLFEQGAAHGVHDEIDDAAAARIAGQARARNNHPGFRRPEMIEARPVRQLPNFAEVPHDALVPVPPRTPNNGQPVRGGALVPVEPQQPVTALAVQQRVPVVVENDVRWLTVAQTDGYLQAMIRALGRSVFRGFPCFAEHERQARQAGDPDPLATIQLLANLGERGRPSSARELDVVASWIRQNGTVIRSEALEFPVAMPGYRPEVVLLVTAEESFLLVRETRDRGAPANSAYVYRWNGGVQPYLDMRANAQLDRLAERPALAPPAGPAGAPPRVPGAIDGSLSHTPYRPDVRRARIATLPMAPSAVRDGTSPLQKLLDIGFSRHADDNGPALIGMAADGTEFRVSPMPGLRLIDGTVFRLKISAGGDVQQLAGVSAEDIQVRFAECAPRPGVG
jgi:hypothetical protein